MRWDREKWGGKAERGAGREGVALVRVASLEKMETSRFAVFLFFGDAEMPPFSWDHMAVRVLFDEGRRGDGFLSSFLLVLVCRDARFLCRKRRLSVDR